MLALRKGAAFLSQGLLKIANTLLEPAGVCGEANFGSWLLNQSLGFGDAAGVGVGEAGIMIVCPACNLRPSSM
jgi:hypothetical protein